MRHNGKDIGSTHRHSGVQAGKITQESNMRTFAINQHNDLVIDAKGDLQICDNDEAVKTLSAFY